MLFCMVRFLCARRELVSSKANRRRLRRRTAWYERNGPAKEVLTVGEMDALRPGPGEVLVRLRASGINFGDQKKRD